MPKRATPAAAPLQGPAAFTQASVRTADRVVVQVGQSLGDRTDCVIVDLTPAQVDALNAAWNAPHGSIYLSAGGAVTADPPPAAPVAPAPDPQVALDKADLDAFMAAAPGVATAIQRDRVIKAIVRRLA